METLSFALPAKLPCSSIYSISARRRLPEFKILNIGRAGWLGSVSQSPSSSPKFVCKSVPHPDEDYSEVLKDRDQLRVELEVLKTAVLKNLSTILILTNGRWTLDARTDEHQLASHPHETSEGTFQRARISVSGRQPDKKRKRENLEE